MKIALMMENSQANKNAIILKELNAVADEKGFPVYNVGMSDENDHHLTYIHLGIMASILLNSKAVDFVVTGCGTGQGALMSLNIHPGVVCGYCIDPADAFLFAQINNGNALSLPFAKGFGWGAELNVRFIFEKAFFVASAPVSIDIAALNVDIGSSGSCQVATSTIQVSLGTVNRAEFHGQGSTGGQAKRFSIPVFCPTPTDVRIGFFGVSVESDTLALSKASNSASGVGVKLTYGNNPGAAVSDGASVKINEASNLPILKRVTGSNAGTAEAINFNAQYVQTDATVTAGTADSMVTFALEYN